MARLPKTAQDVILEILMKRVTKTFQKYGVSYRLFDDATILTIRDDIKSRLENIDLPDSLENYRFDDADALTAFANNFVGNFTVNYKKVDAIGTTSAWLKATGLLEYVKRGLENRLQDKKLGVRCCNFSYFLQTVWSTPYTVLDFDSNTVTQNDFRAIAKDAADSFIEMRKANQSSSSSSAPGTPQGK